MSKEKETIKLRDFLIEIADIMDYDKEALEMVEVINFKCSECGRSYPEGTKFCSEDGKSIIEEKYEVNHEDFDRYAIDTLYAMESEDLPEDYPYEYVDSIEKRGDGDGYWMNYIIKRKADGKFFYITSYEGEIDELCFEETKQKVTVKWDFEKYFS